MGEIARGQEVVELATGFPHLIKGAYSENASSGTSYSRMVTPHPRTRRGAPWNVNPGSPSIGPAGSMRAIASRVVSHGRRCQ